MIPSGIGDIMEAIPHIVIMVIATGTIILIPDIPIITAIITNNPIIIMVVIPGPGRFLSDGSSFLQTESQAVALRPPVRRVAYPSATTPIFRTP